MLSLILRSRMRVAVATLLFSLPVTPTMSIAPTPIGVASAQSQAYGTSNPYESSMTTHSIEVKHTDANYLAKMLKQLSRGVNIVVDERTNSLFIQVQGQELPDELKSLIEKLDKPMPGQQKLMFGVAAPPAELRQRPGQYGVPTADRRREMIRLELRHAEDGLPQVPVVPTNEHQQLRVRYEAAERESLRLAAELAELKRSDREAENRPRRDELQQQLERTVNNAFDLRQQLQEAELAELRKRVESIEQRIGTRRELRGKIVQRRIEDLMNPEQTWDSQPQPMPNVDVLHVVPDVTRPLPPSSYGIAVPPGIPTPPGIPMPPGPPTSTPMPGSSPFSATASASSEATAGEAAPRKLPSDYVSQRQQILREITDALQNAAGGQEGEAFDARLKLLTEQAQEQLQVLTREYEAQRQILVAQLAGQEAVLRSAKAEHERLMQMFRQGVISAAEVAPAEANLKRVESAVEQIAGFLKMFQANREAIVSEEGLRTIIEQLQQPPVEYREPVQGESSRNEGRSVPTSEENP